MKSVVLTKFKNVHNKAAFETLKGENLIPVIQ